LSYPSLRAGERQDFPHFWFYSLLAAPFVAGARAIGVSPWSGFLLLNVLLWSLAITVTARRASTAALAFVFLGPIIWWLDKGHTEVFTVSVVTIATMEIETAPWWSAVAFGAAATQNPPWLVGAFIAAALTIRDGQMRGRRGAIAATGLAVALL